MNSCWCMRESPACSGLNESASQTWTVRRLHRWDGRSIMSFLTCCLSASLSADRQQVRKLRAHSWGPSVWKVYSCEAMIPETSGEIFSGLMRQKLNHVGGSSPATSASDWRRFLTGPSEQQADASGWLAATDGWMMNGWILLWVSVFPPAVNWHGAALVWSDWLICSISICTQSECVCWGRLAAVVLMHAGPSSFAQVCLLTCMLTWWVSLFSSSVMCDSRESPLCDALQH